MAATQPSSRLEELKEAIVQDKLPSSNTRQQPKVLVKENEDDLIDLL